MYEQSIEYIDSINLNIFHSPPKQGIPQEFKVLSRYTPLI